MGPAQPDVTGGLLMSTRSAGERFIEEFADAPSLLRRGRQALSLLGFLTVWWVFYQAGVLNFEHFVSPTTTIAEFGDVLMGQPMTEGGETIYLHAAYTAARVAIGVGVAAVLAIPLGVLVGTNRTWGNVLYVPLEAFRPIPPIAWLPIAIILLPAIPVAAGGTATEVPLPALFVVFIGAFFPIFTNTIEGARNIENEYIRAAKSLGADSSEVFRHVLVPATLPSILTGLALGVGLGWITVVAAELITGGPGLGYVIIQASRLLSNQTVVIGMLAIGGLGYASSMFVQMAGERLAPWADVEGGR